jgi:hypothetical protein
MYSPLWEIVYLYRDPAKQYLKMFRHIRSLFIYYHIDGTILCKILRHNRDTLVNLFCGNSINFLHSLKSCRKLRILWGIDCPTNYFPELELYNSGKKSMNNGFVWSPPACRALTYFDGIVSADVIYVPRGCAISGTYKIIIVQNDESRYRYYQNYITFAAGTKWDTMLVSVGVGKDHLKNIIKLKNDRHLTGEIFVVDSYFYNVTSDGRIYIDFGLMRNDYTMIEGTMMNPKGQMYRHFLPDKSTLQLRPNYLSYTLVIKTVDKPKEDTKNTCIAYNKKGEKCINPKKNKWYCGVHIELTPPDEDF